MNQSSLEIQSLRIGEIEYDEFQRPPNIEVAKIHALATRFARPNAIIDNVCQCCGNQINNTQLSLCVERGEFSFNGSGIVLYFDFVIFATVLISLYQYSLISSLYTLYDNLNGTRCEYENTPIYRGCQNTIYNIYSRSNVVKELDIVSSYLNFAAFIVIIIATLLYRRHINKICVEIDDAEIEASDYSIMVYNIPRNIQFIDIKDYFSQDFQMEKVELRKICMAYEIEPYSTLQQELYDKEVALTSALKEEQVNHFSTNHKEDLIQQIKIIKEKLDYMEDNKEKIFKFSGVVILSYNYEKQADYVCESFKAQQSDLWLEDIGLQVNNSRKFKGNTLVVRKAPLPGDILWSNLGIKVTQQYKRILITNCVTVLLLSFGFGVLFGLSYLQEYIKDKSTNNQETQISTSTTVIISALGFLTSMCVTAINAILSKTVTKFINLEKHSTKTEYDISIAKKLGLAEFFNTAMLTLLVNIVIKNSQQTTLDTFWVAGGLNSDVIWIFVADSFVPWISLIFEVDYLKKIFIRQQIIENKNLFLTQKQANDAFEGPQMDMAIKYAGICKTLMLTFFYSPLLPACSIFAFISVLGIYWIDKIILLRRDSKPQPTGSEMAQEMVEFYIDLMLLTYSAGCIVWEKIIFQSIHWSSWASVCIASLFYILPTEQAFGFILQIGADNQTKESWDEKYPTFIDDYDRRNPVTADNAKSKWLKMKQENLNITQITNFLNVKLSEQQNYQRNQIGQMLKTKERLFKTPQKSSGRVFPMLYKQ